MSKERRTQARYPVLDQFSIFVTIEGFGPQKHRLRDVSSGGLGLELEMSEETHVAVGAHLKLELYLNQSFAIPLRATVVWLAGSVAGIEIQKEDTNSFRAYQSLISLLSMWPFN